MTKAYGYTRISGKGQESGDGVTRQRTAIERYAAIAGIEIVGWYHDTQTGKDEWSERSGFTAMVDAMRESGITTCIAEHADRVARDLGVQEGLVKALRRQRLKLMTAEGKDLTTDEDDAVFDRQIRGVLAEQDRRRTVKKLRVARERIRATGARCEGRKPFGDRQGECEVLARMQAMRTAGATLEAIAAELNSAGAPTRTGAAWNYGTVANILRRCVSVAPVVTLAAAA